MIIIPEQISYLREQREKILASLETYKDYLQNKEITSSDYSARAYIGDSITDEQFHRERKNLREVQDALENDELIITAVDNKHYVKLKNALVQAFETDVVSNPTILNMLENNEEAYENLINGLKNKDMIGKVLE